MNSMMEGDHPGRRLGRGFAELLRLGEEAFAAGNRALWPVFDLFVRLWLAQTFWVSGIVKVSDWDTAMYLATHEYPVSWMDPVMAARTGVTIELLAPILLAFGLATRVAAVPMLILTLVTQYAYLKLPIHEFWAILFAWYIVMGPGPLSLDRILGRGLPQTAVPLTEGISNTYGAVSRIIGPALLLFIRIWMARIFFLAGLAKIDDMQATVQLFQYEYQVPLLPADFAAYTATTFELVCPVLLVVGLATRLAALPLIAMTLVIQFTYLQHIDHLFWFVLLAIPVLRGPGVLSADHLLGKAMRAAFPRVADMSREQLNRLPHVVVIGAGFGGVSLVKELRHTPCRITLIDRRNYHLFQPLLYQVATASLSPSDIAQPIRSMFRDQRNVRVLLGRVTDVDAKAREVVMAQSRIGYDYLVLATGARHSYFGKDDWEPFAPGLKKIDDATDIRRRLLIAFERAEAATDPVEQAAQLTFVVVGGGPTGVELAGAIAELARAGMTREFVNIDPADARVLLIQSAPRLLPSFPEALSTRTKSSLAALGVDVRTGSRVEAVDDAGVTVAGEPVAARTVFWAAGVAASSAGRWVDAERDRAGRIKVGPDLSVPGAENVFAIGDTAQSNAWNGEPVPGLAPAAKQAGAYVGRVLTRRILGRRPPKPFRYRHLGNLATVGRKSAVADFGWIRISGAVAWWLWGLVHVYFLVGARNRVSVTMQWFWAYLTFRRSTRLITGD